MKISFEGLPGTQKDQIFQILTEQHGQLIKNSDNLEWYNLFLSDPKKWALSYELNRLINFHYLHDNTESNLYDSLYALKKVYVDYLLHQNIMTKHEYDTFMKYYRLLYTKPDVIIYFYGTFEKSFETSQESAKKKGGYVYSEEEFKQLYYKYEWVFDNNNCSIPIYKVNVEDDINMILANVNEILQKIKDHQD